MTRLTELKTAVCRANLDLVRAGLVTLTWGNASGIDRAAGLVVIKPSGVDYESMSPDDMVVVDLLGTRVEGRWRPSTDTLTHLAFYRRWPELGGVVHTHSRAATAFAQARREIPCLGTTHADHFFGSVPLAPPPSADDVSENYEAATGAAIIRHFDQRALSPLEVPAVLAAGHGPFAFGRSPAEAVRNAVALEAVAEMALAALALNPAAPSLERHLLEKHYQRKHGAGAYYGQGAENQTAEPPR